SAPGPAKRAVGEAAHRVPAGQGEHQARAGQCHGVGAAHERVAARPRHRPRRPAARVGGAMTNPFSEPRPFPGQDPWVVPFEGSLLLVQSTRNDSRISVMRFADLARMHDYEETVIWAPGRRAEHGRQIWAPELHRVGWRWYVYYAASDGENKNHRTYVLEADDPLGPYHELGKVYDPAHDTFSIDLTLLRHHRRLYAVWSGWEGPDDGFPQNLY